MSLLDALTYDDAAAGGGFENVDTGLIDVHPGIGKLGKLCQGIYPFIGCAERLSPFLHFFIGEIVDFQGHLFEHQLGFAPYQLEGVDTFSEI